MRRRILAPAVELANEALAERDAEPLPEGLTPHSLRRTFASILVALGRDPAVVMRQMGHTSPAMTLGVYAAAMDWADGEPERLRALVGGRPLTIENVGRVRELPTDIHADAAFGRIAEPPETTEEAA